MGFLRSLKQRIRDFLGIQDKILCDTCKWNWRSACHNPERPNAKHCNDYEKRGA